MAKVVMTCGRICSGKSTYAHRIADELSAVILSVDEITLALFPEGAGEMLDTYVERAEEYLYGKSVDIVGAGINVVLDWGFWTKEEREFARKYYGQHGISCELHYLDVPDELWRQRIAERNRLVSEGKVSAYYVDKGLEEKFAAIFQVPDDNEIDVRVK